MEPKFHKTFQRSSSMSSSSEKNQSAKPRKIWELRILISSFILLSMVIATIAVFALNYYYNRKIEDTESTILSQRETLQTETVKRLIGFNQQIQIARELTESRKIYSFLLEEISKVVVPDVRYISIAINPDAEGAHKITIQGSARSLNAYLQQVQAIARAGVLFAGTGFSDYTIVNKDGETSASFEFVVPVSREFIDENIL